MRALILLLTACAPTDPRVTTTAFDGGFGPLASAVWIRTVYEAGVSEGLMLGNVPDLCEKNAALADARATFSAAAEAEDAACGPLTEPYLDAVDAAAAIYAPAAHYLLLDARLSAGRHDVGDDAFGALFGFSGPPVAALADAWDPDSTYAPTAGCPGTRGRCSPPSQSRRGRSEAARSASRP